MTKFILDLYNVKTLKHNFVFIQFNHLSVLVHKMSSANGKRSHFLPNLTFVLKKLYIYMFLKEYKIMSKIITKNILIYKYIFIVEGSFLKDLKLFLTYSNK